MGSPIALFLAMLMAATSTAFANWDSFQGNNDNNGTSTYGVTSTNPTSATVPLPNNGTFTGVDVEPLVVGNRIYALYNGGTPLEDGTGGARLAAVDASNNSLIWSVPVDMETGDTSPAEDIMTKRANNVSQIATPVITPDGKTLYGTYTYTQDMLSGKAVAFSGDYSDGKIGAKGTAVATISNVTLPDGYGNLQAGTDITSTGTNQQKGTVNIKSGNDVVQSFTGNSYETYNFNIYYLDGTPVPGGTYTIEISVENTTDNPIPWSTVSLLVNRWGMFQVSGISGDSPTVSLLDVTDAGYAGQANTPLTLANGKVYFGIYDGDRAYCQYDTANHTAKKFTPGNNDSFYYADATVVGNNVFFGSESGTLYARSVTDFDSSGTVLKLEGADKIRSSVCCDVEKDGSTYIYLTSRNANLWKVGITNSGLVYAGVYGYDEKGNPEGYIVATLRSNISTTHKANPVYSGVIVQCSPVVYSQGTTDYIYFTTNVENGAGYCYKCQHASDSASFQWSVTPSSGGNGYAVQGFAMGFDEDEEAPFGVFGNDNNQLVIVR